MPVVDSKDGSFIFGTFVPLDTKDLDSTKTTKCQYSYMPMSSFSRPDSTPITLPSPKRICDGYSHVERKKRFDKMKIHRSIQIGHSLTHDASNPKQHPYQAHFPHCTPKKNPKVTAFIN
jgi:hypothetical protein